MPDDKKDEEKKETSPPEAGSDIDTKKKEEEQQEEVEEQPYEYSHPALKGKTPEEVEALFKVTERTVSEQGARLTAAEERARQAPPPEEKKTDEVSNEDFYKDPVKTLQRMMEASVAPIKEEVREARRGLQAQGVQDVMRGKFDDWDAVKPYVDNLLSRQDFPNPNDPVLLETLYYTAVGVMAREGVYNRTPKGEGGNDEDERSRQSPPPQHRASTPPRPLRKDKVEVKELNESERVLAKSYNMTHEEYRELQKDNVKDEESGIVFLGTSEDK